MQSSVCKFVFVISPGRSGTAFCAALFGASCSEASGCATTVAHEPLPVCAAGAMRLFNVGRVAEMRALFASKWRTVQAAAPAGSCYVETNAQFVKAWAFCFDALSPAERAGVGVLHLHRDVERVVASFIANGEAPALTAFGDVWNLSPASSASLTPAPAVLTARSAIEFQVAEIEARAAELRTRFPEFRWHAATLDELSTRDGAVAALHCFGLRPRDDAALAAVLADTAVNSGAERAHAPTGANDAEAALPRSPRLWPHDRMRDNVALVSELCDFVLRDAGAAERIRSNRRPLLGLGASCMVGAKRELAAVRFPAPVSLAFSELHFQLICTLCERVDRDDVLFTFVQRVGGVWQLCKRINAATPTVATLLPAAAAAAPAAPFVVAVVGAAGRLAPIVMLELVRSTAWLPADRPLALRLVVKSGALARARGIAADLVDANAARALTADAFSDEQLAAAFDGADLVLLLASAPRQRFDERHHLAARNAPLYERFADALAPGACRIVVVANPTMTLAGVLVRRQPTLQARVSSLMQCDASRARSFVASQLSVAPSAIVNIVAIGNHSHNLHIDTTSAFVRMPDGGCCLLDDVLTPHTLHVELPRCVHERGRDIISLTGHTALLSVATSVVEHVGQLFAAAALDLVSMGVYVDTRCWRAGDVAFSVPSCLPRRSLSIADVWPLPLDFAGFLGMPVSGGGAVDWMAWATALRAPEARQRLEASVRELNATPQLTASMSPLLLDELARARSALLHSGASVLVLAGAGLSADVIPDLLSFERQFAPCVARGRANIFHLSNGELFAGPEPGEAWGFFASRALSYGRAPLSPATQRLAQWLLARAADTWFVETSNVDGQLRRAGVERVFERHGTLFDVQCTACAAPAERRPLEWFDSLQLDADAMLVPNACVPRCQQCGSVQRIATALAVDSAPFNKALQREQRERRDAFVQSFLAAPLGVLLEIGVGTAMPKLRQRAAALKTARRGLGRRTVHIRVNTLHHAHAAPVHSDDHEVPLAAAEALQQLFC
jgi:malate/lactate dehydrogenase/NAD-dependent SIR2 family protein deacetylase